MQKDPSNNKRELSSNARGSKQQHNKNKIASQKEPSQPKKKFNFKSHKALIFNAQNKLINKSGAQVFYVIFESEKE